MTDTSAPKRGNLAIVPTLTTPASSGASSCSDEMTCDCDLCTVEREHRVQRGVRPRTSLPLRQAA